MAPRAGLLLALLAPWVQAKGNGPQYYTVIGPNNEVISSNVPGNEGNSKPPSRPPYPPPPPMCPAAPAPPSRGSACPSDTPMRGLKLDFSGDSAGDISSLGGFPGLKAGQPRSSVCSTASASEYFSAQPPPGCADDCGCGCQCPASEVTEAAKTAGRPDAHRPPTLSGWGSV